MWPENHARVMSCMYCRYDESCCISKRFLQQWRWWKITDDIVQLAETSTNPVDHHKFTVNLTWIHSEKEDLLDKILKNKAVESDWSCLCYVIVYSILRNINCFSLKSPCLMLLISSLKCVFHLLQTGNSVSLFSLDNCIDTLCWFLKPNCDFSCIWKIPLNVDWRLTVVVLHWNRAVVLSLELTGELL